MVGSSVGGGARNEGEPDCTETSGKLYDDPQRSERPSINNGYLVKRTFKSILPPFYVCVERGSN